MKMVLCYKFQIWGPQWHSKAHLIAETDEGLFLFWMHTKYTNQEKLANVVKPHDNICNMLANFRLLIETKIV